MYTSFSSPSTSALVLSLRVYILASERSNSVYFAGMARTSRLSSTANTSTAASIAVDSSPLRNTLPFWEAAFLFHFIVMASSQFQRRFSNPCAVKNRNTAATVR